MGRPRWHNVILRLSLPTKTQFIPMTGIAARGGASNGRDYGRITGNLEVIGSSVGLVLGNALVSIEPINSRMVNSEAPKKTV
jgi:hypothetical protein